MSNTRDWNELQSLFALYIQSDPAATRTVFEQIHRAVEGFFWQRVQNAQVAEDLAQATLLKIHLSRDRFNNKQTLKAWVFAIARNCLIDHWRGASHESDWDSTDENDARQVPTTDIPLDLRFELNHDLTKSLQTLKPIERQIVYLYGVEGLSMAEIGAVLGLTETAVKLRAYRSYKTLREELGALAQILLVLGGMKWMP